MTDPAAPLVDLLARMVREDIARFPDASPRQVVVLHPALRVPGAGQRHVVVAREADRRIVLTRCGIRAAVTELAKPGAWYGNCREGCAL